jgi:hypothetical protein
MNLRREPSYRQRLKPASFAAPAARLKRLRKKSIAGSERPSAAKAGMESMEVIAAVNRCATQKQEQNRVVPQPLKPCPSQNHLVDKIS